MAGSLITGSDIRGCLRRVTLATDLGAASLINALESGSCEACVEQEQGSPFLANLNATPTVPGVHR